MLLGRQLCKRRHPRVFAFQLIELLVVIGVIVILAVLLMPALKGLSLAGANARCVSNLRQMGAATLSYFGEHDGQLLPSTFWYRQESVVSTLPGYNQSGIAEYFGLSAPFSGITTYRETVLSCPAFKKKFPTLFPSMWNRSYSANKFAHVFDPGSQQLGIANIPLFPGNLRNIRKPSAMWMYMDGAGSTAGGFVFTYLTSDHFPYIASPHANRQNAVFFDGHVEAVSGTRLKLPESDDFWGGPK